MKSEYPWDIAVFETLQPNGDEHHVAYFIDIENVSSDFVVLLTVHLSIFISLFNQIDARSLFHNKFYFMSLHVSSTCAHVKQILCIS